MYAPLWVKSNYSFLEGASFPEEIVERCRDLGIHHVALTDINGVYGVVRAFIRARELGIHLIVGTQISIEDGCILILIAEDRTGYGNLCRLITLGKRRSGKSEFKVSLAEICQHADGVLALIAGSNGLLSRESVDKESIYLLKDAFREKCYAVVCRHLQPSKEWIIHRNANQFEIPMVACNENLYHAPSRRRLQDVLRCIRHNCVISKSGRLLNPNQEYDIKPPAEFLNRFRDMPKAVERTLVIAEQCRFSLAELRYRYPSTRLPQGMTSMALLRKLTFEGAGERYNHEIPDSVTAQLHRELKLIDELDYCGYFLSMWEIVKFCQSQNILCQGRGSAANSAVCYCLGITAVDPVQMDLLFERFISRERDEPPDIDLDIEHQRREEVIQHVYREYGRTHAAMAASVVTYRIRSAIRDVGKALGISELELSRLTKLVHHGDDPGSAMKRAGRNVQSGIHRHFLELISEIRGFPRHLSIHTGGFVLGHEPVHDLVPIENATMENRTVIQWDKNDLEELGFFKVDLLGLGALSQLHRSFDLIKGAYDINLSMAAIPSGDPETYTMLRKGDTVGVFQVESRAQMAMLPRLKPKNYYDLVIQISIVRPGPIVGGMVHPYLRRRKGTEAVAYPHPSLEPVLKKTLGVPLFQEQVMKLAMIAADYTPGEADRLRRDMAAWRRSGKIQRHRQRLISRMKRKGISSSFAERVFQQISGFGEYGFPESHAASFALIAYAAAWIKCHYPDVFVCALLNSLPMGFYSAATIIDDAKRHGLIVKGVDVCRSDWECVLETVEGQNPFAVRVGLKFIKGLRKQDWEKIEQSRLEKQFESESDFIKRSGLKTRTLKRLANAGALESFSKCRRTSLWNMCNAEHIQNTTLPFYDRSTTINFTPLNSFERISWDYASTNHSSHDHPLAPFRNILRRMKLPSANEVRKYVHGRWIRYVGAPICRQCPDTASGVVFMTLEDETGFVNIILWPAIFKKYMKVAKTAVVLGVAGRIQSEDDVVHVIVKRLWEPRLSVNQICIQSRDFM